MNTFPSDEILSMLKKRDYESIVKLPWPSKGDGVADPKTRGFRNLPLAMLRAGRTVDAIQHYELLIALIRPERRNAFDSCELGAAHWLQGDRNEAIMHWKQALMCNYGDGANNMTPALILYYSAVRSADESVKELAVQEIEAKLKTGWRKNWPAPLGRYLVDPASEDRVEKELLNEHPLRQPDERCRFEFYRGVKFLESGDDNAAKTCFRPAVDQAEQKTTSTEFVLALHELGETPMPDSVLALSEGSAED